MGGGRPRMIEKGNNREISLELFNLLTGPCGKVLHNFRDRYDI